MGFETDASISNGKMKTAVHWSGTSFKYNTTDYRLLLEKTIYGFGVNAVLSLGLRLAIGMTFENT